MTIPKDLLDEAVRAYDLAVDYFNERDGAGLVKFGQQLVDAGAAGAASRQAEVDAANAQIAQLTAGKATLQTQLDTANNALAAAKADAKALDDADVAADVARGKLHQDVGG